MSRTPEYEPLEMGGEGYLGDLWVEFDDNHPDLDRPTGSVLKTLTVMVQSLPHSPWPLKEETWVPISDSFGEHARYSIEALAFFRRKFFESRAKLRDEDGDVLPDEGGRVAKEVVRRWHRTRGYGRDEEVAAEADVAAETVKDHRRDLARTDEEWGARLAGYESYLDFLREMLQEKIRVLKQHLRETEKLSDTWSPEIKGDNMSDVARALQAKADARISDLRSEVRTHKEALASDDRKRMKKVLQV